MGGRHPHGVRRPPVSGGTAQWNQSAIIMDGAGSLSPGSSGPLYSLTVSGTVTASSSVNVSHDLSITASSELSILNGKVLDWNSSGGGQWSCAGGLLGPGAVYLTFGDDYTLSWGNVSANATWGAVPGVSPAVTLAEDTEFRGNLTLADGVELVPDARVVTISEDIAIDLTAESSFWNVTVESGVTVTLASNITVELRATTIGATVEGAEFVQPAPAFTSTPDTGAVILQLYEYQVTQSYWDTLTFVDYPDWLIVLNSTLLTGVPLLEDAGIWWVNISLEWEGTVTWQNFTVAVTAETSAVSEWDLVIVGVLIHLVLGIGLFTLGEVRKNPALIFLAGLLSLFAALVIYSQINTGWMILVLGFGIVAMYFGGTRLVEESEKKP